MPSEGRMSEDLPVFDDISQLGCGNVVMACILSKTTSADIEAYWLFSQLLKLEL